MSKKKTHEEYVMELAEKNPNLEVIEKYVNAQTKIAHRCKTHNIEWKVLPSNALAGKGCKECMKDKNRNKFTKSHDEYVSQVKTVNPNIMVLGQYINHKIPILHLCKKHNIKWEAMPTNILKGGGCQECGKEKYHKKRCKKQDEYMMELTNKNPTVEVIEDYIDSKTPILHHCLIHEDIYWNITPSDALLGHGCPKCRNEKVREKLVKNHEEYVKELFEKNPNVEVVEKYIDAKTKILHHCLVHGEYWYTTPTIALQGSGCPKCLKEKISKANTLTNEEYIQQLKEKNSIIIPLEPYVNITTPIYHKCLIHDYDWQTTPATVLQGCGCPKCRSEKISVALLKTHEQYVEDLKNTNPDIIVLEKYVDANTPILHKCLLDGNEWLSSPTNILSGTGCPQCTRSKGEKNIRNWLDNNNIAYEVQKRFNDCKDNRSLSFDFYLPNYNLCIEYDGEQHYRPVNFGGVTDEKANLNFDITVKHDNIKNNYCKNNGISLLRIPYFKNIEEELNNFLFI